MHSHARNVPNFSSSLLIVVLQVDRVQDVFQFGIVIFFCLFGSLPWQRADVTDPNFAHFYAWRSKKTSKPPKNFKPLTSRAQKLFRKLMDIDPSKRLALGELGKYTEDRWLKKVGGMLTARTVMGNALNGGDVRFHGPKANGINDKGLSDGISQLTMGSFQSVHSNAVEKNRILYTLLQHGVETTVDRTQKNSRIINWINESQISDENDDDEEDEEEGEAHQVKEVRKKEKILEIVEAVQEVVQEAVEPVKQPENEPVVVPVEDDLGKGAASSQPDQLQLQDPDGVQNEEER
jgi:serine/threonine protein kinase